MRPIDDNPERVVAHGNGGATRPQPRWGCETPATFTQGSSSLATLGFVAESLWDSPKNVAHNQEPLPTPAQSGIPLIELSGFSGGLNCIRLDCELLISERRIRVVRTYE